MSALEYSVYDQYGSPSTRIPVAGVMKFGKAFFAQHNIHYMYMPKSREENLKKYFCPFTPSNYSAPSEIHPQIKFKCLMTKLWKIINNQIQGDIVIKSQDISKFRVHTNYVFSYFFIPLTDLI